MTADVEIPQGAEASGVLCAHHNSIQRRGYPGGWACYLIEGRIVVTVNFGTPDRVTTNKPLPDGRREVQVIYQPASEVSDGTMTIVVDQEELATGSISAESLGAWQRDASGRSMPLDGKLFVGHDQGFPVCEDYQSPSVFSGHIHRIVLEIGEPSEESPPLDHLTEALKHD